MSIRTCDICIIGGGIAGITLALKFKGQDVILVERNGQPSNGKLEVVGDNVLHAFHDYLKDARDHGLGGTSSKWANYVRPMDPIDFEKRDWVPHSGWPISDKDIEPYYKEAYSLCKVPSVKEHNGVKPFGDDLCYQQLKTRKDKTNFGEYLNQVPDLKILNGELTGFKVVNGKITLAVTKYDVIKANKFFLCCGGYENGLILKGLGIQDAGKYFVEHIHVDIGSIKFKDKKLDLSDFDLWEKPKDSSVITCLPEEIQIDREVLNSHIDLDPMENSYRVRYIMEHCPAAESEVFKDSVRLKFNPLSDKTIKTFLEIISNHGEVTPKEKGFIMPGYHHIGTTRMGNVVDENCKVLGIENMWVGGSSTFPTAGHAPPTFTIVAMALRLADHIGGLK